MLEGFDRLIRHIARKTQAAGPITMGAGTVPPVHEEHLYEISLSGRVLTAEIDVPDRRSGLRGNFARQNFGQSPENRRRHVMAGKMTPPNRSRRHRVQKAPFRRCYRDRRQSASIVRCLRVEQAFHRVSRVSLRVVQDAVDRPAHLFRRACEIDRQGIAPHPDGTPDIQGHVDAVHVKTVAIVAVGNGADRIPHAAFRPSYDLVGDLPQVFDSFFVHKPHQHAVAIAVGGELRPDIPEGLLGLPQVFLQKGQYNPALSARFDDLANRDRQSFLVTVARCGRRGAANIDRMCGAGGESDETARTKQRMDHRNIVQVTGPDPGIVGDDRIAWRQIFDRIGREDGFQRPRQGSHKARDTAFGLRELPTAFVEEAECHVVVVTHDNGERRAHEGLRDLIDDAVEPAPDQSQAYGIKNR